MQTMYPGFTNSPSTTLTSDITDIATTIPVAELSVFPAAPNIAVIGTGEDAETILYAGKSAVSGAGNLTTVTREIDKQTVGTTTTGEKLSWLSGEVIGRNFTHLDHYALYANMTAMFHEKTITISPVGGDYQTIQAALTANPTEYTMFLVYPGVYTGDTVYFSANNQSVIGLDNSTTQIIGSVDTNVVNFAAYTGCVLNRVTVRITGATSAISTVTGTTGGLIINDCTLDMTNASVAGADQPACVTVTGAGTVDILFGFVNYTNTVAAAAAIKAAIYLGNGAYVRIKRPEIVISTSGASVGSTLAYSAGTGVITVKRCQYSITDPDTNNVLGLYITGTAVDNIMMGNHISVTAGAANIGTGIWAAGTSTIRSATNHIHVSDAGGTSYSFQTSVGCTITSSFDDIIAVDGVVNAGTYNAVNSPSDGNLFVTGTVGTVLSAYSSLVTDTGAAELGQLQMTGSGFPIPYGKFVDGGAEFLCWVTKKIGYGGTQYVATVEYTSSVAAGTVIWKLYAVKVESGATYDVTVPLVATMTSTFAGVAYSKQVISSSRFTITGTGDTILWKITRDAGDTLVGDALYLNTNIVV